jgi:hypothetical protein
MVSGRPPWLEPVHSQLRVPTTRLRRLQPFAELSPMGQPNPKRPSQASLTSLRCFAPAVGDMVRSTPAGGRIAAGSGASPRTGRGHRQRRPRWVRDNFGKAGPNRCGGSHQTLRWRKADSNPRSHSHESFCRGAAVGEAYYRLFAKGMATEERLLALEIDHMYRIGRDQRAVDDRDPRHVEHRAGARWVPPPTGRGPLLR